MKEGLPDSVKFVRLLWCDNAGIRRCRYWMYARPCTSENLND